MDGVEGGLFLIELKELWFIIQTKMKKNLVVALTFRYFVSNDIYIFNIVFHDTPSI